MSLLERMAMSDRCSQRVEAAMALIIKRRLHDWCSPASARIHPTAERGSTRLSQLAQPQQKTAAKTE